MVPQIVHAPRPRCASGRLRASSTTEKVFEWRRSSILIHCVKHDHHITTLRTRKVEQSTTLFASPRQHRIVLCIASYRIVVPNGKHRRFSMRRQRHRRRRRHQGGKASREGQIDLHSDGKELRDTAQDHDGTSHQVDDPAVHPQERTIISKLTSLTQAAPKRPRKGGGTRLAGILEGRQRHRPLDMGLGRRKKHTKNPRNPSCPIFRFRLSVL